MKILETQSAVLSNYEVLAHLTATHAKPRTTPQKHSNVNTVLKEVSLPHRLLLCKHKTKILSIS